MRNFVAKEEALRLKYRNKIYLPITASGRAKRLHCRDFTIVSNNCWGGTVYESYGMKKLSPTVGMFIMPDDFIKFVGNLEYYFNQALEFVDPALSKWKHQLEHKANWGTYLIAKLDDIELHMLHYHDEQIAKNKWDARVKRVNWKKLIVKFNDQNGATPEHIKAFMDLPIQNKLCFVTEDAFVIHNDVILIRQPKRCRGVGIKASREPVGNTRVFRVTDYLNAIEE